MNTVVVHQRWSRISVSYSYEHTKKHQADRNARKPYAFTNTMTLLFVRSASMSIHDAADFSVWPTKGQAIHSCEVFSSDIFHLETTAGI